MDESGNPIPGASKNIVLKNTPVKNRMKTSMAKKNEDKDFCFLQKKYKELEEKYEEMKEKHAEMEEKFTEMEQIYSNVDCLVESVMPEFRKYLKKLELDTASEYADINNKLSDHAQKAIQDSKGPLKPGMLLKFLLTDIYGKRRKKILKTIEEYSNNADGVKKQLIELLENVEGHMEYRKNQEKIDVKFIKIMKSLDKKIEAEKIQTMHKNNMKNLCNGKLKNVGRSGTVEDKMTAGKRKRNITKRKEESDFDSCSSQDSQECELMEITTKAKRMKLSSSESMSENSQEDNSGDSKKVIKETKSKRKLPGRLSEQESGLGTDLFDSDEDEETVRERSFSMSGKTSRSK